MLFKPSIAVVGFAAISSAFLLPPTVASSEESDIITTLPFEISTEAYSRSVNLECTGCPVPVGNAQDGLSVMTTGIESELQLNFQINHLKDADVLTLNGVQIFPISLMAGSDPLKAAQILSSAKSDDTAEQYDVNLGYESRVHLINDINEPNVKEALGLYNVHIQIIEVEGMFVDGLKSIDMKLIVTPTGGLMIGAVDKSATTNPTVAPGAECSTMLCKLKEMMTSSIGQLKPKKGGCGGAHGRKGPGKFHHKGGKPQGEHGHRGPHHHRHHSRIHRILRAMKSIALQVLLPVCIGIACGFAASFIGMVVGHSIVFLWRTFFRRGQAPAYTRVSLDDTKVLIVEDAPPAYSDAEIAVVDEKVVEQ